jgi:hypothetical protein
MVICGLGMGWGGIWGKLGLVGSGDENVGGEYGDR